jgi:hypothetical protein
VTATEATVAVVVEFVTVKPSPPETPPLVARTLAEPAPTPVINPDADTVTIDEFSVE